jgi:hypothetical protein
MGYTGGAFAVNRDAIMASRPAPLAISMLGYPSTGALPLVSSCSEFATDLLAPCDPQGPIMILNVDTPYLMQLCQIQNVPESAAKYLDLARVAPVARAGPAYLTCVWLEFLPLQSALSSWIIS